MRTVTPFDTSKHHIYTKILLTDDLGDLFTFKGVVDTGAPWTEFSDRFLAHVGLIDPPELAVEIKPGLETQKYRKIVVPSMRICGQNVEDLEVMVSRFDPDWGIAALIGLDFFRRFRVTIDYERGELICELHGAG